MRHKSYPVLSNGRVTALGRAVALMPPLVHDL